ncbi:alpha/beta hydrolase family protein [Mariniphaga sediminis]|nr:acetylxylan esterase [Mariniphaga sediminis]
MYWILFFPHTTCLAQKENLKVFNWSSKGYKKIECSNGENILQLYLNQQAYNLLDRREQEIASLKTKQDWENRQKKIKTILSDIIGDFPDKTPLNAKITGVIHKEGFRIEKIIFESLPGFFVTGCLYIPEGKKEKRAAILNVIGHSAQSFRRDLYQNFDQNLVKKGFIVFAIDPIGGGERIQYYDPNIERSVIEGETTNEHSFIANQYFLMGGSLIKYYIWDGIRAIDYLVSREEVDSARIGLTGPSGGGQQTAFISSFDDRIKASAPTCYITSYRRMLETIGPQDGEQTLFHWLTNGLDHADLVEVQAPKPALIVGTTNDFFSIQGVRETFEEVKKVYQAFGQEGNISLAEANYRHGLNRKNNEATYAFFQKELENPGSPIEEDLEILPEDALNVTSIGMVSTSYNGKTVFDLIKPGAEKLAADLEESRKNNPSHLEIVKQKAKELSGYVQPKTGGNPIFTGCYERDGYTVEKYILPGDKEYEIPLLLAIPDGDENYSPVIYIHPEGKEKDIAPGDNIEKLVKQGFIVAAPDLLGTGETQSSRDYPGSHGYGAILIGRSIVGIQAGDIVRVVDFLKRLRKIKTENIHAIAFGEQCPALLHAAVFEPSIAGIALVEAPVSYYNITQTKLYQYSLSFDWGVAGALTAYDLPDLAACVAPRKQAFIGLLDGEKKLAVKELVADQMTYPRSVYTKNNSDNLKIIPDRIDKTSTILIKWLTE